MIVTYCHYSHVNVGILVTIKRHFGGPPVKDGACEVLTLMWMRTIMNYQYRYGRESRESREVSS